MRCIPLLLLLFLLNTAYSKAQTIDTLINVGNYQLHFKVTPGEGTPIIFEAGNGDDGTVWDPILEALSEHTGAPLITYDRAGLGKSGIDTNAISFRQEIMHLQEVLSALGFDKDYFLVAHSFGGFYASSFADQNRGKIRGAVFIETATPCFMTTKWAENYVASLPDEAWKMIKQHRIGLYYTLQNLAETVDYMSSRYLSSDIPLTFIVAEHLPNENTLKTKLDRENWKRCNEEFGRLPNRKYVLAEDAEHHVWQRRAQLVIDEIIALYEHTKF